VLLLAGDRREDEQIPLFPVIAYAGGAPVVDLKPSVARKALKRFTQGGAGDAELFSQFAFGGSWVFMGKVSLSIASTRRDSAYSAGFCGEIQSVIVSSL